MCLVPLAQAAFSPDTETSTQFLHLCFADLIENHQLILSERTPHYSVCKYWCISLYQWLINSFLSCYPGWFHRYPHKTLTRFLDNHMTRKVAIRWLSKPPFLLLSSSFLYRELSCGTGVTSINQTPNIFMWYINTSWMDSASTWPGTQIAASLWWHLKKHTWGPSGSE